MPKLPPHIQRFTIATKENKKLWNWNKCRNAIETHSRCCCCYFFSLLKDSCAIHFRWCASWLKMWHRNSGWCQANKFSAFTPYSSHHEIWLFARALAHVECKWNGKCSQMIKVSKASPVSVGENGRRFYSLYLRQPRAKKKITTLNKIPLCKWHVYLVQTNTFNVSDDSFAFNSVVGQAL